MEQEIFAFLRSFICVIHTLVFVQYDIVFQLACFKVKMCVCVK